MSEQDVLDLEDAQMMLTRIAALRLKHDQERDEVARLTRELAAAKRRQKEAGWKLGAAERAVTEQPLFFRLPPAQPPPALPAPKRRRKTKSDTLPCQ